jgi:cholesterol transport system auxiliary component
MTKKPAIRIGLTLFCSWLLLAGCTLSDERRSSSSLYDLGPLRAATHPVPPVNISIAEVNAAAWLDNLAMFYRLSYANDQQPRAYAHNRWVMPPGSLLEQRLKARIAQAGGIAASASDAAVNLSLLKIEVDDFSHVFESPAKSHAQISLRASVFNDRVLIAQKSFAAQAPAPSMDAAGAAKALVLASDAVINDLVTWLATLRLKR